MSKRVWVIAFVPPMPLSASPSYRTICPRGSIISYLTGGMDGNKVHHQYSVNQFLLRAGLSLSGKVENPLNQVIRAVFPFFTELSHLLLALEEDVTHVFAHYGVVVGFLHEEVCKGALDIS